MDRLGILIWGQNRIPLVACFAWLCHYLGMSYETKWLKVGTAGATVDGRVVKERWLSEMAENYDPKNEYKAQVWAWSHWNHYQTYGKVTAFKAEEDNKGRLSAYVKLSPLPELVSLNRAGQLQHASMEIHPNYKREGKAYLTGLLLTNDPASVGTQEINLAKGNSKDDEAVYTEACAFSADMDGFDDEDNEAPSWFTRFTKKYLSGDSAEEEIDEMKDSDFEKIETMFSAIAEKLETDIVEKLSKEDDSKVDKADLDAAKQELTAEKDKVVALKKDKKALEDKVAELSEAAPDQNTEDQDNFGSNGKETENFS